MLNKQSKTVDTKNAAKPLKIHFQYGGTLVGKDKHIKNSGKDYSIDSNVQPKSKSGNSFVQNPDQNNQIHKEALGPNAKR